MHPKMSETLFLTLPPAYKASLRRLAEEDAEPMAAVVRQLIRREARARGLWTTQEPKHEGDFHHVR